MEVNHGVFAREPRDTCTLFRVLARDHRRWRGHGALVWPLGTETRAQRLYGVRPASVRLGQGFLRPVQLLHERLAVQVRVSQICKSFHRSTLGKFNYINRCNCHYTRIARSTTRRCLEIFYYRFFFFLSFSINYGIDETLTS